VIEYHANENAIILATSYNGIVYKKRYWIIHMLLIVGKQQIFQQSLIYSTQSVEKDIE